MARTINPHLFGGLEAARTPAVNDSHAQDTQNKKYREIEAQVQNFQQKFSLWAKQVEAQVQALHATQKSTQEQIKKLADQLTQHQVIVQNKFNERRNIENRSQDLLDRHQQVVQNFEARMAQLQRLVKEQEMKIMSYQASYDEILREIRTIR